MKFRITALEAFEWSFTLRMPFRFGVITVRDGIQAVLRARIRTEDGHGAEGMAAETMAAKWFDKDPALTDAQNQHQLRRSLEIAMAAALTAGPDTAFGHYAANTATHTKACAAEALNPLVASFGRALVDRARALETGMAALAAERPVIIDGSDGPLDAFVAARAAAPATPARSAPAPAR
jgi:hypothetical protein